MQAKEKRAAGRSASTAGASAGAGAGRPILKPLRGERLALLHSHCPSTDSIKSDGQTLSPRGKVTRVSAGGTGRVTWLQAIPGNTPCKPRPSRPDNKDRAGEGLEVSEGPTRRSPPSTRGLPDHRHGWTRPADPGHTGSLDPLNDSAHVHPQGNQRRSWPL